MGKNNSIKTSTPETTSSGNAVADSNELTLAQRVVAPTPKFFRVIRSIGLVIGLIGAGILTSPVALPAAIVSIGGYLAVAGTIATGIAQTAVGKE